MVTSPNYPSQYPHNLEQTQTIQVEQGLILSLLFTAFNIQSDWGTANCNEDHLTIADGDGTILMEKSCGSTLHGDVNIGGQSIGFSLPSRITSRSNIVNLVFKTDGIDIKYVNSNLTRTGWSVSWSAVTPGYTRQLLENDKDQHDYTK